MGGRKTRRGGGSQDIGKHSTRREVLAVQIGGAGHARAGEVMQMSFFCGVRGQTKGGGMRALGGGVLVIKI